MTKTKHKNSRASQKGASNRSWIWALIIIIIIVALVALAIFVLKPQPESTSPADSSATAPTASSTPDSDEPAAENPATPEDPESKVPQYEGEDPNTLEELTGVVISKDVSDGTLSIMTMINQYLHQTGICVLTLTGQSSHNSYTASVDAHADISTSYCESFSIPAASLASDTYNIEIKITSDGKTGTIRDEVRL